MLHIRGRRLRASSILLVAVALTLATATPAAAGGRVAGPAPVESEAYRLPFEAGQDVLVAQGWNDAYSHTGLAEYAYDFVLPEGSPILASAAGTVTFIQAGNLSCGGPGLRGESNYVTIDHADGTATHYGHLSVIAVAVGEEVRAGQVIGLAGRTGFTNCDAHLHFTRQALGGAVTQSLALYFVEYPGEQLLSGQVVMAVGLDVELDNRADLVIELQARLEAIRRTEALSGGGADTSDGRMPYFLARRLAFP